MTLNKLHATLFYNIITRNRFDNNTLNNEQDPWPCTYNLVLYNIIETGKHWI